MLCCFFDPLDMLTIECSWILASHGFSLGASKFPYNEALHFRSSVLESHDDIAKGIGILFFFGFSIVIYGSCTFFQLGLSCTSILLVHIFFLAVNLIFWSLCRHTFFCGLCKVSRSDQMIQCHPRFVLVIQIKFLTTYVWKGYCLLSARWDFCFIENEICY